MIENEQCNFTQAMDVYGDMVTRIALLRMKNQADAKDVFQNVFLRLYERPIEFLEQEHLRAWLIKVTIRFCINESRRFWHKHRTDYEDAFYAVEESHDYELLCYLAKLPGNIKQTLYLHYYEGYTFKEIADILNTKENTVKSWARRGRLELRELLGGEDDE